MKQKNKFYKPKKNQLYRPKPYMEITPPFTDLSEYIWITVKSKKEIQ